MSQSLNQSLIEAIPEFVDEMNLRYQPRTKMMVGHEDRIVADYIDEMGIKNKNELHRLFLLIRKRHGELRWPSLKAVIDMEKAEGAAHRRGSKCGKMVNRGSDQWRAWEDYYRNTDPEGFRFKYMQKNDSTTVPAEYPPKQRSAA